MAGNSESRSGGGSPINITAVIAVLTVFASIFLVSRKLSSDRPVANADLSQDTIGEQTVEARLWEDPMAVWGKLGEKKLNSLATNGIPELQAQILSRGDSNGPPLLLPVMLSSGAYSEDREARIRSRFAVVSALGESGYVPEDAEHIGAVRMPWPTTAQLQTNENKNGAATLAALTNSCTHTSPFLLLSFEWYRKRDFYASPSGRREQRILLLWLEDDEFEDDPLLRLAFLFSSLTTNQINRTDTNCPATTSCLATNVYLIGPRRSSTLRAMLPGESSVAPAWEKENTNLWHEMTGVLQRVSLFIATPSAMDEVLVKTNDFPLPRMAVERRLTNGIFQAAYNFSATDSQLAREILEELALRQVNLTNKPPYGLFHKPPDHLVLISEWDTFYGRMLSLTYGAELAIRQSICSNRSEFIGCYLNGEMEKVWPTNLNPFVYLRGLDGQTTTKDMDSADRKEEQSRSKITSPTSPEQLRQWTPDANKAEGRAQFDNLGRLGDRIAELEKTLREEGASIGAIGIVGSDVYDTLLILQTLRPRFPSAVFFTTDLDARFLHPSVWAWSRNLVVASGYGLQLGPDFQKQIPPFRDSAQTAQFAATLAALGNTNLLTLSTIPPRRFEIGRSGAVDLSVTNGASLHPKVAGQSNVRTPDRRAVWLLIGALVALILLASMVIEPWRQQTVEAKHVETKLLWLREEDIGGLEGFQHILNKLDEMRDDPLVAWLKAKSRSCPEKTQDQDGLPSELQKADRSHNIEIQMQAFLDLLNDCLHRKTPFPMEDLNGSKLVRIPTKERYRQRTSMTVKEATALDVPTRSFVKENRLIVDEVLDGLLDCLGDKQQQEKGDHAFTMIQAAASARLASWKHYKNRRRRRLSFWIAFVGGAAGACALALVCWRDTFACPQGEPFSFVSGASAWPAQWLRFLAFLLTLGFIITSYAVLRGSVLDITRRYRLLLAGTPGRVSLFIPTALVTEGVVWVNEHWTRYQQLGRWWNRGLRIIPMLLAYLLFGFCFFFLCQQSMVNPLRGSSVAWWNSKLLFASVFTFLVLNFWTMDAACLCRWFVKLISERQTRYPEATREHFSRLLGEVPDHLLNEWIDLSIIAEITDNVGRMIYFPFIIFFILLLARNSWWDQWTWSLPLVVVFLLNLVLATGSVVILQRAARRAHKSGLARLQAKIDKLRKAAAHTKEEKEQHTVAQAEKLLEEIRGLHSGAFGTFWENPIVGALLVPSGGTALIELVAYLLGR